MNRQEKRALEKDPVYHFQLAEQLQKQGNVEKAIHEYQHAIRLKPNFLEAYCNVGNAFKGVGEFKKAVHAYEKAIQLSPDSFGLYLNLASVLHELREIPKALAACEQGLALNPTEANGYFCLSNLQFELGELDKSLSSCNKALELDQNFYKAYHNIALVNLKLGQLDKAEENFLKVLQYDSSHHQTWMNLSDLYCLRKEYAKAQVAALKALNINFNDAQAHLRMGALHMKEDENVQAVPHLRTAIHINPNISAYWYQLAQSLKSLEFEELDDLMQEDLVNLISKDYIDPADLYKPIFSALLLNKQFVDSIELAAQYLNDLPRLEHAFEQGLLDPFLNNNLFLLLMKKVVITGKKYEMIFTRLRELFLRYAQKGDLQKINGKIPNQFILALATQCLFNEYVFACTAQDLHYIDHELKPLLQSRLVQKNIDETLLALFGCYRKLIVIDEMHTLKSAKFSDEFKTLLEHQVFNPIKEIEIKKTIPALTQISQGVSQLVQNQYEENPYPRWLGCNIVQQKLSAQDCFKNNGEGLDNYDFNFGEPLEILIAGCGSGKHPIQNTSTYNNSNVTAVDLSLTSLAYAIRKTQEYGINYISYYQADILKLDQAFDKKFDIIECSGVLHHLEEPMAGWQVIRGLLKPKGIMRIGLYSETARQHIVYARNFIKKNGYRDDAQGIRDLRAFILNETQDPMLIKCMDNGDFYTTSACRDLLFHVQEHRFTIPLIKECLKQLNLKFIRFEFRSTVWTNKFKERFGEESDQSNMDNWEILENENPDMFIEMYQFLCVDAN